MKNVIAKALPTALTVIIGVFALGVGHKLGKVPDDIYSSLCVMVTGFAGILLLFTLAKSKKSEHSKLPFSIFRLVLSIIVTILFILGFTKLDWWFSISESPDMWRRVPVILLMDVINFGVWNYVLARVMKMERAGKIKKKSC